jgi:hypothetical protein
MKGTMIVYAGGDYTVNGQRLATPVIDIYDSNKGTWTRTNMSEPRYLVNNGKVLGRTLESNGNLYILGGTGFTAYLPLLDTLDLATKTIQRSLIGRNQRIDGLIQLPKQFVSLGVTSSYDEITANFFQECNYGGECHDSDFCTQDICNSHTGFCDFTLPTCDPSNLCGSYCDAKAETCYAPFNTSCEDFVFCNGDDFCDGNGTCMHTGNPCANNGPCNNTCNNDSQQCVSPAALVCRVGHGDDQNICLGNGTCDGNGTCVGITYPNSNISCTTDEGHQHGKCDGTGKCVTTAPPNNDNKGPNIAIFIGVGAGTVVALILILYGCWRWQRRRLEKKWGKKTENNAFFMKTLTVIELEDIVIKEPLGAGNFGEGKIILI